MKLEEILDLEWVNNNKLFEMATPKKEAKLFIAALGAPIVEQFLKLTYFNSLTRRRYDYRHSLNDGLNNYLRLIQSIILKEDNKRPDPEDYYIWLFDDIFTLNESNITAHFRELRRLKYSNVSLRKDFNATEVKLDIEHLFNPRTNRLLLDIAAGKFDTITDYYTF
ncbi:MAG: hypothetical protein ACREAU_08915 [Nitrosopumilaceae archaeon]